MSYNEPDLIRLLDGERDRLVAEFGNRLAEDVVREQFDRTVKGMADARVKQYVPLLAYRLTREQLRATSPVAAGAAG